VGILREASERFVEAAPYNVFVEVSGLASEYWPLWKEIYDTRFIHIVIDGRKWVQKLMWYKCFTEERPTTYGVKHKPATAYEFPSMWFPSKTYSHDDNQLNRFHKCCDLWAGLHNWFAEATDVFVRVEDFNKPEAGQLVLDTLYPEATAQQVATFTLKDPNYHGGEKKKNPYTTEPYGIPHWKNWDDKYNEIFASVCGETMKRFGYY